MSTAGRILIVDDTLASLKLMADTLRAESYEVYATDNGELALAAARNKLPDLILCDIRMPGMDGLEVCRRLKAQEATRAIPLMFISAATAVDEKVAGFAVGAVDFVSKPFQRDELLARVHTHLELSRLRHQLEQRVAERTAQLNAARELSQSYLDLVEVTIVSLDPEGRVRMLNRAGKRLFGYQDDAEVLGRSWFADFLAQPEGAEVALPHYLGVVDGRAEGQDYVENSVVTRRGEVRTMAWHNTVQRDASGAFLWSLSAGEDITARKADEAAKVRLSEQLQAALREVSRMNEELESRVVERTSELESALLKLRQTSRHLAQAERTASLVSMVSGVARELKGPIGHSLSAVAAIGQQAAALAADGAGSGVIQQAVQTLRAQLEQADQVIREFEELALSRNSEQRSAFSLQTLVGEVLASQLRLFKSSRHQVVLDIAPDLQMEGFPRALGQVLTNLLNNALTHAFAEGASGEIHIRAQLRKDGDIELLVSDNGCGISAEYLPHVFEPFFTTRRGQGRRGLGLSLVYATVHDILGGSIQVGQREGGGAVFTLVLPAHAPVRRERL